MSNFKYTAGFHNVGSYLVSSTPYLTASLTVPELGQAPLEINLPNISKFVIIRNETGSSGDLRVGFSLHGVTGTVDNNYVILSGSESFSADYRVKSIYLLSHTPLPQSASIVAGLTTIPVRNFNNWSGSNGVG